DREDTALRFRGELVGSFGPKPRLYLCVVQTGKAAEVESRCGPRGAGWKNRDGERPITAAECVSHSVAPLGVDDAGETASIPPPKRQHNAGRTRPHRMRALRVRCKLRGARRAPGPTC